MKEIVSKLTKVMNQVKYIQKRGRNSFHNYNYATEADVNEKVREVLSEMNVMMIPNMLNHEVMETTTAKGAIEYIVTVDMEFTFIDGDSGERINFKMSGSGQDRGDKGIFKAISGAQKYALMKVFMIPTGDDPEADESVDERNHAGDTQTRQQQTRQQQNRGNKPSDKPGQTKEDILAKSELAQYATANGVDPKSLRALIDNKHPNEWTVADCNMLREKIDAQLKQGA